MHPAHVPFEAEAEAAEIGRARDAGPGGAFLGDGHDAGMALVADFVEALEEIDRLEIFAAADRIFGTHSPGLARVVEVEHRGHGIHAQAVDVIFVEPEERVGDEEIAHLVAAVVEDERAPVLCSPCRGSACS